MLALKGYLKLVDLKVKVPKMVYARVRLENGLKGYNDLITVQDQQGTYTRVSR